MPILETILVGTAVYNVAQRAMSKPQRQFATRVIQVRNDCPAPITVRVDYYTVGVDGRWQWRQWENAAVWIKPGRNTNLVDKDDHPIHGSIARCWWTTADGVVTFGGEKALVAEPYLAEKRQTIVILAIPPKRVFRAKQVQIQNDNAEPIRVYLRYQSEDGVWREDGGYVIQPGKCSYLNDDDRKRIAAVRAQVLYVGESSGRNREKVKTGYGFRKTSHVLNTSNRSSEKNTAQHIYGPEHIVCPGPYGADTISTWTYGCKFP